MTPRQALTPPAYPTNALDRGLRLLQLVRDEGALRVMDAAAELGVARSTAHRLLQTLVYRDFLIREDHTYLPGPALSAVIVDTPWSRPLRHIATPHMESLASEVRYATNLMIRVESSVRFLKCVTFAGGTHDRRGSIWAAHRTSGGKAMLSLLDDDEVHSLYHSGDSTLPDAEFSRLSEEIARVRRTDYATAKGEFDRAVSAVGVAIRDQAGRPIGALTISAKHPTHLIGPGLDTVLARLQETRHLVENDLEQTVTSTY